jgi:hypothetical protein
LAGNATVSEKLIANSILLNSASSNVNQYLQVGSNGNIIYSNVSVTNIGTNEITNNSITSDDLGSASVDTDEIKDGSVTGDDLANKITLGGDFVIQSSSNITNNGDLFVKGNTVLGDSESDTVSGGAAGGNVWFTGNLIAQTNQFSLGTAVNPWQTIYAIDLISTSDERLKEDIEPLEYGLDEVMKLRPVTYNWKDRDDDSRTIGLLAQEVEAVIDEAVNVAPDEIGSRGVRYTNMVPVLIKAIQEQQKVIDSQRKAMEDQELRMRNYVDSVISKMQNLPKE